VAIQMDAIESIHIDSDSTFALAFEAQSRGHEIYYYRPATVTFRAGIVLAPVQELSVRYVSGEHFVLGPSKVTDLAYFDVILCRQDPPFDIAYATNTYLLELLTPKTLIVNDPAGIRNAPEKLLVTRFAGYMPKTLVSSDRVEITSFKNDCGALVFKRLYGMAGDSVLHIKADDDNFEVLLDVWTEHYRQAIVVQEFLPAIRNGDKRIVMVDGQPAGVFNRVPKQGDFRANLAAGGAAEATCLTARDREICAAVGPTLSKLGLLFAGLDVVDGYITEINVISPTGLRAIMALNGVNIAERIWDVIQMKCSTKVEP
jgi:glutathione synthase